MGPGIWHVQCHISCYVQQYVSLLAIHLLHYDDRIYLTRRTAVCRLCYLIDRSDKRVTVTPKMAALSY